MANNIPDKSTMLVTTFSMRPLIGINNCMLVNRVTNLDSSALTKISVCNLDIHSSRQFASRVIYFVQDRTLIGLSMASAPNSPRKLTSTQQSTLMLRDGLRINP